MASTHPHPLKQLTVEETDAARDYTLKLHEGAVLEFREIFLEEPPKADLVKYLDLEHSGQLSESSPQPARLAKVQYDVIGEGNKVPVFHESVIDLRTGERTSHEVISSDYQAALTIHEFMTFIDVCQKSSLYQSKVAELKLPEGFEVVIEPWPYGGMDATEERRRFFQGLLFAQDKRSGNPDSNFYAFPLPLIPIMDWAKKEIVKVLELATGGKGDSLTARTQNANVVDHCKGSEYVPELLPEGPREGLKPLHVVQPDGPSFTVTDDNLIEWQNWRMRLSFNTREGAVLHDVTYQGRSVIHRLSMSEMTVPYADPREPYHRKQAFDFGDGGAGNCANNLTLGCDCLGVIRYFDGVTTGPDGKGEVAKNVVCLHEQDNGIGWKHTNWRTGRAVVTRRRELVFQFIITLANYEYAFYYILDQAGAITVQVRATGIVSVVNIDEGKQSDYGKIVSPGALAQNHQHIFCVRIDPSIDGHKNTVVQEESLPVPMNPETNPSGNYYQVVQTPIKTSSGIDADPSRHRLFKIQNRSKLNPVSGTPVGYKIVPPATQLLLADPNCIQAKRAEFAKHHLWVTKHKDNEFYAGGRFTLQSTRESEGVGDAAARGENVEDEDIVVWSSFGLTHNPRVEDWPVMPVEMLELHITPSDFFTKNPAIDVPSNKDLVSKLANGCCEKNELPVRSSL
ncbi:copper amine oxidase [Pestalotiopsis sp. NC0098]|nr:copper amine oxidase [Pestalotiopsis sp. NC0098]